MAATPKPASTVVLVDNASRVYMTKRPETMKFLGGFYVFPGGKVDKEDYEVEQGKLKKANLEDSFHYAHYVAAARELFEEVGILLACKDGEISASMENEKQMEYRRLLISRELSFIEMLQKENLQLDLTSLIYFGHIITPEFNPIRFDTRFFLAKLPEKQIPIPYSEEIDDAFWILPEEALKDKDLRVAPPTLHSLKTLVTFNNGGGLQMPKFNLKDYITPHNWKN